MPENDSMPEQPLTEGQKEIINALNDVKPVDQADGHGTTEPEKAEEKEGAAV